MKFKKALRKLFIILKEKPSEAAAVVCVVAAIVMSGLDLGGVFSKWEKSFSLILLLVSTSLFFIVPSLLKIEKKVSIIETNTINKAEYFRNKDDVIKKIKEVCEKADHYIYATGTKTNDELINSIEKKIKNESIEYKRLIITRHKNEWSPGYEQHLKEVESLPNVSIRFREMPNCPSFLITDKSVMIILPLLERDFRGVLISEAKALIQYKDYFWAVFHKADKIILPYINGEK